MTFDISKVKIVVFVPSAGTAAVREAVCNAGAGVIGDYSFCTTRTESTGTFVPNENAKPFIGIPNKLEFVKEDRLEFVCEVEKVKSVIKEIRRVHSYEEPAIDIIPLLDEKMFD